MSSIKIARRLKKKWGRAEVEVNKIPSEIYEEEFDKPTEKYSEEEEALNLKGTTKGIELLSREKFGVLVVRFTHVQLYTVNFIRFKRTSIINATHVFMH